MHVRVRVRVPKPVAFTKRLTHRVETHLCLIGLGEDHYTQDASWSVDCFVALVLACYLLATLVPWKGVG